MRLAVLQTPSPEGDLDAALDRVEQALRAAAAARADALVVPEVFLPGYNLADPAAHALADGAPALQRLSAAAARAGTALVLGYAEAHGDRVYNSALCIGPDGRDCARYRKVQLYGPREKAIYTPGDAYATFALAGRRAALLICYDIEFAPHVAALARLGTEVILVPTANMAPYSHVVRHTVPAMAANHGLAIAYANYCGSERDLTYVGGSLIVGPHGEILAQAGDHPALLIADVPETDPERLSSQARDFRAVSD
ncbi:MAG: nitrilase-related carbon-nitrogen hydrolase [Pseudomonadota bacterium]